MACGALYPSDGAVIRNWRRFLPKQLKEARYHLRF